MEKAIIVLLLGILSLFVGALIGVNILGIAVAAYVAVNTNKWFYEKEVKRVKYLEPLNNRWLSQTKPPLSFLQPVLPLKVQIRCQAREDHKDNRARVAEAPLSVLA